VVTADAPIPQLGNGYKVDPAHDDQTERPYWKFEGQCPCHNECQASKNSWQKVCKFSFESEEAALMKIAQHLLNSPLHKSVNIGDEAWAVATAHCEAKQIGCYQYWETFSDREEARKWEAGQVEAAQTKVTAKSKAKSSSSSVRKRAAADADDDALDDDDDDGDGNDGSDVPAESIALREPKRRRRTLTGELEVVDIVNLVMETMRDQHRGGPGTTHVPAKDINRPTKAMHSTMGMLDQIIDVGATMQRMANSEELVLQRNINNLEESVLAQNLGFGC